MFLLPASSWQQQPMCNVPLLAFKALMIKMHCNAFGYGFFRCEVGDTRLSTRTGEVIKNIPKTAVLQVVLIPIDSIQLFHPLPILYSLENCSSFSRLRAFFYCNSLRALYCLASVPPRITGISERCITVYVPAEYLDAYKADFNWGVYNICPIPE